MLVTSLNGAGHFGRTSAIAERLLNLGHSVSLVIGEQHLALDRHRIHRIAIRKNSDIFYLAKPLGLEGPHWGMPSSQTPDLIPPNIIQTIEEADFVVSDNSVWPLKISESTILMAQFLWIDYWRKNSIDPETLIEVEEALLCEKVKVRFASPSFQMKSSFVPESKTLPLKLFRYSRDLLVMKKPIRKEIWLVSGTTKLNKPSNIQPTVVRGGIELVSKETFHLAATDYRPAAIAGRPGLGSIRDALGAGIPFLPLWNGEDHELEHNSRVLLDRNLIWPHWNYASTSSFFHATFEQNLLETQKIVLTFINEEFVSFNEAVNQLLQAGERILND